MNEWMVVKIRCVSFWFTNSAVADCCDEIVAAKFLQRFKRSYQSVKFLNERVYKCNR